MSNFGTNLQFNFQNIDIKHLSYNWQFGDPGKYMGHFRGRIYVIPATNRQFATGPNLILPLKSSLSKWVV